MTDFRRFVVTTIIIVCAISLAMFQELNNDNKNDTSTSEAGNTSSEGLDTAAEDSSWIIKAIMVPAVIILWILIPFIFLGFVVPISIVFRTTFAYLIGEEVFMSIFGGTGGTGPMALVESALHGVVF